MKQILTFNNTNQLTPSSKIHWNVWPWQVVDHITVPFGINPKITLPIDIRNNDISVEAKLSVSSDISGAMNKDEAFYGASWASNTQLLIIRAGKSPEGYTKFIIKDVLSQNVPLDQPLVYLQDLTHYEINGQTVTTYSGLGYTGSGNFCLFAVNGTMWGSPFAGNIYYLKVWKGEDLLYDLVPGYYNGDYVLGNKVDKTMLTPDNGSKFTYE